MFSFSNLQNSNSGDARRHVPFASIIHKHIFPIFFLTIFFLYIFFRPYKTSALAQLTPEIQPVYDTTIETLYEFVRVQLDDSQRQAFDMLLGSYMVGYGGMADYKLDYVYSSTSAIKEWLINSGADIYNTLLSLGGIPSAGTSTPIAPGVSIPNIGYQQLKPLLQIAMGCAIKSKNYTDADDALNDIQTSDKYTVPLNPDIMNSMNSVFGYYNGLDNWQVKKTPFETTIEYDFKPFLGTFLTEYNNYVEQFTFPVRYNINYSPYHNGVIDIGGYSVYHNLFIDTDNQTYIFCNDYGSKANYTLNTLNVYCLFDGNTISAVRTGGDTCDYAAYEYSLGNFNTYGEAVQYIFNHTVKTTNGNQTIYVSDFCDHVYYGVDWQHKQELNNITDLNLQIPNSPVFYQGIENGLLDIKGLLADLLDENELKHPVINNYYYEDGNLVPENALDPATQNVTIPESGVDIPQDVFNNFFVSGSGKSFVSYLWYMTKPLVLYTKDLFDCLIFDPVEDFAASGPGFFVFGVIGLGLISGFLAKCLL